MGTGEARGTIRPYQEADQDRVMEVWLASARSGHPFFDEAELSRQGAQVRDLYLPSAETWVYEEDGQILGFIGLLDAIIGGLFIAPAAQRHGIGRALVMHAFSLKGPLSVEVFEANASARAFYAACGFTETSRKTFDDHDPPLPLIVLLKARP